ncbi:hypothetical protein Trydic_g7187 [Trypoxylus dichotomus]
MILTGWEEYIQDLLNSANEITIQDIDSPSDNRNNASRIFEKEKITEEQLEEVIKGLKNGKAPGDDKLTTGMCKNMGYHATQLLLDIYNNVGGAWRIPKD